MLKRIVEIWKTIHRRISSTKGILMMSQAYSSKNISELLPRAKTATIPM